MSKPVDLVEYYRSQLSLLLLDLQACTDTVNVATIVTYLREIVDNEPQMTEQEWIKDAESYLKDCGFGRCGTVSMCHDCGREPGKGRNK